MKKHVVFIAIISVISAVLWIGFSVYFTMTNVSVRDDLETYLIPIASTFPDEVLGTVNQRVSETLLLPPSVFRDYEKEMRPVN